VGCRLPAALLALGVTAPTPLAAQRYWDYTYAPGAYYSTVDGFWVGGFARAFSPVIGVEERPEPHLAWADLRGGASTEGSYFVHVEGQAPAWWNGWRAALLLARERHNRLGYYGLGNETVFSRDSTGDDRPYFYRVSRTAVYARATVQRRLVGPVRLLAGASVSHTDYRGLPGATVFERDLASGALDPGSVPFADAVVRIGVVVDTRDHEIDPHAGVLLEALYTVGRGYRRATGSARVYVRPVPKLTLAARAAAETVTGEAPLAALGVLESSESPTVAVGGYHSLRGYAPGRFTGRAKLLAGLEIRHALVFAPPYEVKAFAFYDAGRVFGANEALRLSTTGLHGAGGAGGAARLGRNTLVVLGAGFTAEGWDLLLETRWSY
jgi:hypothetical protein